MSSIWQCQQDIQKYRTLSSNLNSIMIKLSEAAGNVHIINSEIKNKYQINDSFTPIVTRTTNLKKSIDSTYNYLKNTVIPAIDLAISDLNKEIEKIEREERERREKEERERREREERERLEREAQTQIS